MNVDPDDVEAGVELVVTAEFFDYLLAELERPARANPKMVELLRKARGSVEQRD